MTNVMNILGEMSTSKKKHVQNYCFFRSEIRAELFLLSVLVSVLNTTVKHFLHLAHMLFLFVFVLTWESIVARDLRVNRTCSVRMRCVSLWDHLRTPALLTSVTLTTRLSVLHTWEN